MADVGRSELIRCEGRVMRGVHVRWSEVTYGTRGRESNRVKAKRGDCTIRQGSGYYKGAASCAVRHGKERFHGERSEVDYQVRSGDVRQVRFGLVELRNGMPLESKIRHAAVCKVRCDDARQGEIG